jgi:hypothetical protein
MNSREYTRLRWKLMRIEWRKKMSMWIRDWQRVEPYHEEQLEFRL